jgi:hypothetical protein
MSVFAQTWYGIAARNTPLAVRDWAGGDISKVDHKESGVQKINAKVTAADLVFGK